MKQILVLVLLLGGVLTTAGCCGSPTYEIVAEGTLTDIEYGGYPVLEFDGSVSVRVPISIRHPNWYHDNPIRLGEHYYFYEVVKGRCKGVRYWELTQEGLYVP